MRSYLLSALVCTSALVSPTHGLNILMSNDDGFGSANTREFYRLLRSAGSDTWFIASAVDQSGQGGRFTFTTYPNLTNAT